MTRTSFALLPTLAALVCAPLMATETEHTGLRVLPVTGTTVDGASKDWDLSAGLFGCSDVENQRDKFAFWAHAGYDAEHLYLLMRFVDPTPLNNPGQVEGDYGFQGDSLQFRVIVGSGGHVEQGRASHWTCWRGRDGKHVMDVAYGAKFDKGGIKDAQPKGAKQAFVVNADTSGYAQELAIPWSLIAPDGWKPMAGEQIRLTFEPNYTVGTSGRLSVKDLFQADVQPDRVFTFMASQHWGYATLAKPGKVEPAPVRLSDRREFAVSLKEGVPAIDWTGLIKQKELTGHKAISFEMPFDGYISLNIFAPDGTVARQLLKTAFYTKGKHEVKWDGLSTFSWRNPGEPVPAGSYTWQALVHPGLDLKLVGWAANAGSAPWDGPSGKDNWGGDHGLPASAAAIGDRVLLGWSGAEAGKAMVACDTAGNVQWKHSRQGMSGCQELASDGTHIYGVTWGEKDSTYAYRLAFADGAYVVWPGKDTPDLHLHDLLTDEQKKAMPDRIDAIAARDGQLYLASAKGDALLVCDSTSGALKKLITVKAPVALAAIGGGLSYCSSDHQGIQLIDSATGTAKPFADVKDVWGLTTDQDGNVYAAVRGDRNQVVVFDKAGKELRAIGRKGGRPAVGRWDPSGMRLAHGIAVDGKGQLWVTEEHLNPKRISVWDAKSGAFVREMFGPATYGALGGSISPKDPSVMSGLGSEWKIDATTGKASCLGVIDDGGFQNSRFVIAANKREYLVTSANWAYDLAPLKVFEHRGPGEWKLRSMLLYRDKDGKDFTGERAPEGAHTVLWADKDDDATVDADECSAPVPGIVKVSAWHMMVAPDLTMYSGNRQFRTTGFTACGAPTWDLAKSTTMPANGMGSADGSLVLSGGNYGEAHAQMRCFDIATGKQLWWYPDNFVGVHGSHNAPPPEVGMVRGSYSMDNINACGTVKLPAPIGNVWVISTNVGEWHLITEQGFYLSRLFQPDQMKVTFPEKAVPGALLNDAPCGMGGEDFGGSATYAADGKLYVQSGKTGFWNVQVDGIDKVQQLKGGPIAIAESDRPLAETFKEQALQTVVGKQRLVVKQATPAAFTGDLDKDFAGAKVLSFEKSSGTRVRAVCAWDDAHLHVGWEVQDKTAWVNGGRSPDAMYWGGDTVDLQLGTDLGDRDEAAKGDLRLSIGNCNGKDTAVVFRKVADQKHAKTFSSGVVKAYVMDSVLTLDKAAITVTKRGDGYVVEASIPAADLGIAPKAGMKLKGDFGATFGNQAGDRTRLRSYWSNQKTGIVDDVVFELQMEPKLWGELVLE
ncbi:MAG: hypothetical protein H0W72_02605 [Planctomycetes bacterium]|nr:hypothetical protein [Planctomycetota bacterium]